MGLKSGIKAMILKGVMNKRQRENDFDEVQSESYQLPDDAAEDMNNSYYFTAHSKDGAAMFFRYAQRGGGAKAMAEVWIAYRDKDGTAYVNEDRLVKLSASPVKLQCVKPLKEWNFSFKGKMYPVTAGEDLIAKKSGDSVLAEWNGVFTSQNSLYEFSRDTAPSVYCRAVAAEKWYKGFSKNLQHAHQIHIEQDGHIKGTLSIGGKKYTIDEDGIRDHSYGRRSWSYMNRHTWLIGVTEDGARVNVNAVRYPVMNVRGLRCGYKIKDGKKTGVADVKFEKGLGLSGTAPAAGKYTVKYTDGTKAACSFKTDIAFPFDFTDKDGGYIIYEGVSAFCCGGVSGRGITEFGYNADKSRYENPKRE